MLKDSGAEGSVFGLAGFFDEPAFSRSFPCSLGVAALAVVGGQVGGGVTRITSSESAFFVLRVFLVLLAAARSNGTMAVVSEPATTWLFGIKVCRGRLTLLCCKALA